MYVGHRRETSVRVVLLASSCGEPTARVKLATANYVRTRFVMQLAAQPAQRRQHEQTQVKYTNVLQENKLLQCQAVTR